MGNRIWYNTLILFFGLLLISENGFAQVIAPGYTIESWTREDGLPTNGISGIGSLGDGYIWLTTFDGLVRFNGIVRNSGELFTTYNKSNTEGISTNRLTTLEAPDSKSELFIGTEVTSGSNNTIHFKDGKFRSFGNQEGLTGISRITEFDAEGHFWLVNDDKIFRFENDEFVQKFKDLDFTGATEMFAINEQEVWVEIGDGETLIVIKNGVPTEFGEFWGIDDFSFNDASMRVFGVLHLAADQGFYEVTQDSWSFIPVQLADSLYPVREAYQDPTNSERIILGLNKNYFAVYYKGQLKLIPPGLAELDKNSLGQFELIGSNRDSKDQWLLIGQYIFHNDRLVFQRKERVLRILNDDEGSIWLIDQRVLYRITPSSFYSYNEANSEVSNIYPILEDHEGTIWAGELTESVYRKPFSQPFEKFDPYMPDLSGQRIYSILEDSKHRLWFGNARGIFLWDRESPVQEIQTPFYGADTQVRALFEDNKGQIWAGSERGIYSFDSTGTWTAHQVRGLDRQFGIRTIYEDSDGILWFGTNGDGLLYYDPDSKEAKRFEANARLSDTIVRSFYQDAEGIYWVGMEGGGLNRIERSGSDFRITHYNESNGLFGGVIHAILEDSFGRFWMSCNQGIFWVAKSELNALSRGEINQIASTVYDESDGLPGVEANGGMQSTAMKTSNGEFWFSMVDGIAVIDPNKVSDENLKLTTRVEELITPDSSYQRISAPLELGKEERDLQFNYVGYAYTIKPENVQFRYRLNGYNEDWILVGNRNEAFFTNVPAGDYTFVVQASIFGGAWENNEARLDISIAPYFWETWMFRILSVIAVAGFIFLGYRVRVRALEENERKLTEKVDEQTHQLKEQAERLQELDKAKSRFFANVTHEFRTPLTLTIGPLEDMQRTLASTGEVPDPQKVNLALRNSKRLLKLVNQILDISKLESGSMEMHLSKVNIVALLGQLSLAFSGLAERKGIRFNYEFSVGEIFLIADPDMMEKIFVNLLSNAFKFTPKEGEIEIAIAEYEEDVVISIRDSGPGIEKGDMDKIFERFYQTNESKTIGQAGTGIGLSLTRELVELHKGSIHAESEPGKDSVFTVILKKGADHFEGIPISELEEQPEFELKGADDPTLEQSESGSDSQATISEPNEDQTTILIIDDNAEIRAYLKEHLQKKYRILESNNGVSGLETAVSELPDVIICDVMMPKMDGFEFCEELKSNPETDFIPVILLTAKAEQSDKLGGLGLGADDYIIKPFDIEEVKVRTSNLINSRKILKERFSGANGVSLIPEKGEVTSADEQFLEHLKQGLESHIDDEDFSIEQLTQVLSMSRSSLYRKVDELLGISPSKLIIDFRLEKAHYLLSQKAGTISEIAYSVGFKSIAHFSRSFKAKYEQTPRAFLNN